MKSVSRRQIMRLGALGFAGGLIAAACGETKTVEVPVEVVKEVPVEVVKEVPVEVVKEVVKEVPVDRVVERQVVKEVPVEVVKEVVKEVPVDRVVEKVVRQEVVVEKIVEVTPPPREKPSLVFSDLNWSSAQLQNRIAQYIVEKGYGYPTDVVFGATLPLFQGLRRGDSHITMEIWLPNQDEAWAEALAAGEVVSIGHSLGNDWQSSFVIPAYLQEEYPDLDSVEDLKDEKYKALFRTTETGDKARLVSCVIGWACEAVNAAQVEAYGLSDHVQIVNPGDGAALNADLYGAYERREPWLGYQWGTNDPSLVLDLVRLKEPAYSDECWFTTKACAYEDATILIAVHPDVLAGAPDVVEMLRAWGLNIEVYGAIAQWQLENPDASTNDAALWWLKSNPGIWTGWVTADAATAIQAGLDANDVPDGWPVE